MPQNPVIPLEPNPNQEEMSEETRRQLNRIIPGGPGPNPITPEQAAELSSVLIPRIPRFNVAAAAGLPRNANPYVVTLQQAFTLALINARVYQLQLENLYNAALDVTLQRFAFEPQFYAGMHPTTSPMGIGFPGVNPTTQFIYNTMKSPGGQVSTLTTGEVAGMGKAFSTGGQLLMGFANQVVFNFVGKNPIQPTVQSSLPLSFVQPFLRGAGRAVVLENLTQAERTLLYQVRTFAKFRQDFIVDMLTGGQIPQPASASPWSASRRRAMRTRPLGSSPMPSSSPRCSSTSRTWRTSSSLPHCTSSSSRASRRVCRSFRSTRSGHAWSVRDRP